MNASEELSLASNFPYIRLFQAGLNESAEELIDLKSIAVQWSAPTAGNSRFPRAGHMHILHRVALNRFPIGLLSLKYI